MLLLPKIDITFNINTDVRNYQLGGVVSQENKSVVLFHCKLTNTHIICTSTRKELLCIVETIKEFFKY